MQDFGQTDMIWDKVDFIGFPIFSIGGQLGFWNIFILKPCSLIMLHVKFENHRCSGFNSVEWIRVP